MASLFGNKIKISIFGQSHADVIGVCIDGLPAGESIDEEALAQFMARRAPGNATFSTKRKEPDKVEILTGLLNGKTCGAPLMALIRNTDCHSKDYSQFKDCPRPSHADYVAEVKHKGFQDVRGGGHFSGRLTAPLCIAGAICKQFLQRKEIHILTHIYTIGGMYEPLFEHVNLIDVESDFLDIQQRLENASFPVFDESIGALMQSKIEEVRLQGDSLGGGIECIVHGMPVGIGDGMFDGIENRLSVAVFGVPAVKGIEFGNGFACMALRGSENNDAYCLRNGKVQTLTNRHGGILGGISSGMPIVFRVAIKPTPSISLPQQSVSLAQNKEVPLSIEGRHDPCIVPRAVPCIEAATAITLYDMLMDASL